MFKFINHFKGSKIQKQKAHELLYILSQPFDYDLIVYESTDLSHVDYNGFTNYKVFSDDLKNMIKQTEIPNKDKLKLLVSFKENKNPQYIVINAIAIYKGRNIAGASFK